MTWKNIFEILLRKKCKKQNCRYMHRGKNARWTSMKVLTVAIVEWEYHGWPFLKIFCQFFSKIIYQLR